MSLPEEITEKCFVGWRGWSVYQPGLLRTQSTIWLPGEKVEAVCLRDHRCPGEHCRCGIYAFKEANEIFKQSYSNQDLLGEVWLWGRVVEHQKGYRAEYAYPKKFYATERMLRPNLQKTAGLVEYVAYRYGVELEVIPDTHELVSEPAEVREARARRVREEKIAKMLKSREKRKTLEQKAAQMPSSDPTRWKNLMEEIEWETKRLVAEKTTESREKK